MNTRKILPFLVAAVVFLAVCIGYFAPQFNGKTLRQHDVIQYEGMTQDILEHREKFGEDPQWAGNMFSGMPAYTINMKYDNWVIRQLSKVFFFLGQPSCMIFIAMSCFFMMLLCMRINPWVSIVPSLAYGLSSYFFIIVGAGHITKMITLAFAPMFFGGIYYAYRRNMWTGAALAGFFAATMIAYNHTQIVYYFLMVALAFVVNEFVRSYKDKVLAQFAKTTALLLLAGGFALGSNAALLYYVNDHAEDTTRGGSELKTDGGGGGLDLQYATSWSYGVGETLNLMVPNVNGGSSRGGFATDGKVAQALEKYQATDMATKLPGYWGGQSFTEGPVYIGAVIIFIAMLGLFLLRGRNKWWLVAISAVAIMLSWGHNMMWFSELFFKYFPGYNKFRTVSMILVIVEWCVPLLAALTLQKLGTANYTKAQFTKAITRSTIIMGSVLVLIMMAGSFMSFSSLSDAQFPDDVAAAMRSERASMMRMDALRSLFLVAATAAVIWLFNSARIKKWAFVVALCALVAVDLIPVNLRYMGMDRFVDKNINYHQPTKIDLYVKADKEPGFRVANLSVSTFEDATTSYFHRSVGGYHGAKLSRYQDLINTYLGKGNMEIYNMLNTKYFIIPNEEKTGLAVELNSQRNGAAWFVTDIKEAKDAKEEIEALGQIDTKSTAVVQEKFASGLSAVDVAADSASVITMSEYRVNLHKYEYRAESEGIVVFSEIYYPKGWTAYIDEVEAPYFRADYVLRAMVVPPGEHTVEFRFKAPKYDTLTAIHLVCGLVLIAAVAAAIGAMALCKKRCQQGECNEQL